MNRQNTVDPVTELFERVSLPFKKKELSLLLIVGVIGCIGTMSIFNRSFVRKASTPKNLSIISIADESAGIVYSSKMDPFLDIQGDLQSSKTISFTVFNHNPKALYEVNFGDGNIVKASAEQFNHVYSEEGNYEVELIIHYKDASSSIYNTDLRILPEDQELLSSL